MNTGTRYGLSPEAITSIKKIFINYPQIKKVVLYGSRAMGSHRPGSDIDLTLMGDDLDLTMLMRIENEIDDLLLPNKVDLSLYHQIDNKNLREHIERVGIEFT